MLLVLVEPKVINLLKYYQLILLSKALIFNFSKPLKD